MSTDRQAQRWLRKPWLHFMLLGAVIYAVIFLRSNPGGSDALVLDASDEARIERQWKLLGSQADRYASLDALREQALTEKVLYLEALKLDFHRQDPAVRQRLLATLEILDLDDLSDDLPDAGQDDPMETAIALGLHLGDEVVRQRMVLMMQVALEALSTPAAVTEDDVAAAYEADQSRWVSPATISFSQAFLGEAALDRTVRNSGKEVSGNHWATLDLEQGLAQSKPFLSGYHFTERRRKDVENVFGERFATALFESRRPLSEWQLPIPSAFGMHAVWIEAYIAEQAMSLAQASDRIRQELEAIARAKARAVEVNRLRASYGLDPVAAN